MISGGHLNQLWQSERGLAPRFVPLDDWQGNRRHVPGESTPRVSREALMPKLGPTLEQLKSRLKRLVPLATAFAGTAYRSSTPPYAIEDDLLTGEGSKRNGGRWNPPGIAVVYASLTPEVAMAETLAHNRYYGIAIEEAMPRTFVAIEATLQFVLDLREGGVRQRLQVSEERILSVDWRKEVRAGREPIAQMIGRAAHETDWEGLIVPSAAAPNGHNLLIFPDKLLAGSSITVLHPDRL
jgi:RES domain-containing protein